MALLAKRLPVVHIPEQPLVASVWQHMIYDSCWGQLPVSLAGNAQRMTPQIGSPRVAPPAVVAPEGSAAAQPVAALGDVFLAIDLPLFAESGTAGEAAGAFWFHRHNDHLRE